jgi:hypothetical protein
MGMLVCHALDAELAQRTIGLRGDVRSEPERACTISLASSES